MSKLGETMNLAILMALLKMQKHSHLLVVKLLCYRIQEKTLSPGQRKWNNKMESPAQAVIILILDKKAPTKQKLLIKINHLEERVMLLLLLLISQNLKCQLCQICQQCKVVHQAKEKKNQLTILIIMTIITTTVIMVQIIKILKMKRNRQHGVI